MAQTAEQHPRPVVTGADDLTSDILAIARTLSHWVEAAPDAAALGIARGHGVGAGHADDLEGLARQLQRGFAASEPYLVELRL